MDTINSVQNTLMTSASELKKKTQEVREKLPSMAEIPTMVTENLPDLSGSYSPIIDSALDSAKEYRKMAETTYMEGSQKVRERIIPYAENAEKQVNMFRSQAEKFIDDRMSECEVENRTSLSKVEQIQTLSRATYLWLVDQLMNFFNTFKDHIFSIRSQISTDEYLEGSLAFYMRWLTLLLFVVYDRLIEMLPVDRMKIETRITTIKDDYIDPAYTNCSEMVEGVKARGREVVDKVEPLKEALLERSNEVQAMVKQSVLGDILEKGMESLKKLHNDIDAAHADPSDTTDASPSDKPRDAATAPTVVTTEPQATMIEG